VPGTVPYAELHCHSNFSFLDGASHPEELVTEAARLGLEALALTDHNGFYGIVRFAEAARAVGLPTVFGTEITLTPGLADDQRVARSEADTLFQVDTGELPDAHAPDPHGRHLVLLADGPAGYARLARALSLGHLAGEKGAPQFTFADIADAGERGVVGAHRVPQGGGAVGAVRRRAVGGPARAGEAGERVRARPGARRAVGPRRPDRLGPQRRAGRDRPPGRCRVRRHQQRPLRHPRPAPLATAVAAVRARRSLDELDPGCPAAPAPTCARVPSSSAASPATRAWSSWRARSAARRVRPRARRPEPAAVPVPRDRRSRAHRDAVPPPPHRGGRRRMYGERPAFTLCQTNLNMVATA
jgi:error-prone DNA polymerase